MIAISLRRLVAAVALFALGGCTFGQPVPPTPIPLLTNTPASAAAATHTIYSVQRGAVTDVLSFPAKVAPAKMEELFFAAGGRIQEVYVKSGDTVKLDQPIAVLDTRLTELDRQAAVETLNLARQRLAIAETTLRFISEQRKLDLASEKLKLEKIAANPDADPRERPIQELAVRKAELALEQLEGGIEPGLQSEVTRSDIALHKVQTALDNAQITAPFAGQVLLYEGLAKGKVAQAYTPVAALVDPAVVVLEANLLPADLQSLQEGMMVEIALGGSEPRTMAGVVRALPQPYGTSAGATVLIAPTDAGALRMLRPGADVNINVARARRDGALWLPPDAIQGYKDNYYVRMADGSERPVETGIFTPTRVEITAGLVFGEAVAGK